MRSEGSPLWVTDTQTVPLEEAQAAHAAEIRLAIHEQGRPMRSRCRSGQSWPRRFALCGPR